MKAIIYARVSTEGQTLEQQINACKKYCEIKEWDYDIKTEIQSSIKERPVFKEVLKDCREGKYNNIVVFKLDRAWRMSRDFIMDFDSLQVKGVNVISVMEGLDPSTPIGKATMTILVALAELERENISLATKQRLDALKNLGVKLGRPKGSSDEHKRSSAGYVDRWRKQREAQKPSRINSNK